MCEVKVGWDIAQTGDLRIWKDLASARSTQQILPVNLDL